MMKLVVPKLSVVYIEKIKVATCVQNLKSYGYELKN